MKKRLRKFISFIFVILLILVISGYLAISYFLSSNNLKYYFVKEAEKIFGVKVPYPEEVTFSFTDKTFIIKNAIIPDISNNSKPFLKVSKIVVQFRKIIFGIKIKSILVADPEAFIKYDQSGLNFAKIGRAHV